MTGAIVHFEIHASDVSKAKEFYETVFGWKFEDWSEFASMPYWGIVTREEGEMGINGGLMQRQGDAPAENASVNGAVITAGVENYDETHDKIVAAGGTVALPKAALPGMAWQGYYKDTDGNIFGIHQPDTSAA